MKSQTQDTPFKAAQSGAPVLTMLQKREIRPILDWTEWKGRWSTAITYQEMLGLLHVGMLVPTTSHNDDSLLSDHLDRIIFYFKAAEGWDDRWIHSSPLDRDRMYVVGYDDFYNAVQMSLSDMRQIVARKAFEILCQKFFKPELHDGKRGYEGVWGTLITGDHLFPVIQNFFRVANSRSGDVRIMNLPFPSSVTNGATHNTEQSIHFLLRLADFMFNWTEKAVSTLFDAEHIRVQQEKDAKKRAVIDAAKPWMIEILLNLNRPDLLKPHLERLNGQSLAKLREIAMRARLDRNSQLIIGSRAVRSIEEACLVGSPAAWLLKEREISMQERQRLLRIKAAEDRKLKAEQRLRALR
jgi:hypothetical protein